MKRSHQLLFSSRPLAGCFAPLLGNEGGRAPRFSAQAPGIPRKIEEQGATEPEEVSAKLVEVTEAAPSGAQAMTLERLVNRALEANRSLLDGRDALLVEQYSVRASETYL